MSETTRKIYDKRLFLTEDINFLAAVSASVATTDVSDGRKYMDVDLTIVDNSGDKVYLGFWDYDHSEEPNGTAMLKQLRDVIDELLTGIAEAKVYCGDF